MFFAFNTEPPLGTFQILTVSTGCTQTSSFSVSLALNRNRTLLSA